VPANSTHPDYDANLTTWLRARDVIAGEDAVKTGATKYLPRLDSQSDNEYLGYKPRACFFNATSRTCDGFIGGIRPNNIPKTLVIPVSCYRSTLISPPKV
jgi:hypothetical protein